MTALAVLSLVPVVVGAGCCAAGTGRRVDPVAVGTMLLMVVAMTDTMLVGVLSPVRWAVVLGVCAIGLLVTRSGHVERVPRGVHLAAMAVVLGAIGLAQGPTPGMAHPMGATPQVATALALGATTAFLAYALVVMTRAAPLLRRVETAVATVSLVAMAAMV